MTETKEKTIDGKLVSVSQFPARRALHLKIRLIKLLGPSLAQLLAKTKNKKVDLNASLEEFTPAIEKLTAALDPDVFVDLVLELLSMTRVGGREVVPLFDTEYAGNLMFVYKMVWWVLEVNFGNFFGQNGIGSIMAQVNTNPAVSATQKS